MKVRFFNPSFANSGESGTIVPFLAIVLVPLLLVISLAVDSANLYQGQLRLQRASDAGAVAGVLALDKAKRGQVNGVGVNDPAVLDPTNQTAVSHSIKAYTDELARLIVLDNTRLMGLNVSAERVGVSFGPAGSLFPDTVYVDSDFERELWLIPRFLASAPARPVKAVAGATIGESVIAALVVDFSTSVSDDDDEVEALKGAFRAFVSRLGDGDYLELNFFNRFHNGDGRGNQNVVLPITRIDSSGANGVTKAQIETAIDAMEGYDVGTGSNGQGGLQIARMQIKSIQSQMTAAEWSGTRKIIVFASDGRLNAHTYPIPTSDGPLPLTPTHSSATHNKERESARAMGIQQADLARADGIEIFSVCSQGCRSARYSIPTMQRIAADSSWDGSIEWQVTPDSDGYYNVPLAASAIETGHFFLVEDTDGKSANEYGTLAKEFARLGDIAKNGLRMVR